MAGTREGAIKAWDKRGRKQQGAGSTAVQSGADFARQPEGLDRLANDRFALSDAVRLVKTPHVFGGAPFKMSDQQLMRQAKAAMLASEVLRDGRMDMPSVAVDQIAAIESTPDTIMAGMAADASLAAHGDYSYIDRVIRLNADFLTDPVAAMSKGGLGGDVARVLAGAEALLEARLARRVKQVEDSDIGDETKARLGKTLAHEIGHHAHLSKLGVNAAREWAEYSKGGKRCRISSYGRQSPSEHFAEVFAAYVHTDPKRSWNGFNREVLRKLEPKAFEFMERLFRDATMWQPHGEARADPYRRYY